MNLTDNITTIKGIGDKTALLFSKASVFCVNDIIHYFPRTYETMPLIKKIYELKDGELSIIKVYVTRTPSVISTRSNKKILSFKVSDGTSEMKVSYFNMPYLKNTFKVNDSFIFYGIVRSGNNELVMANPKVISEEEYEGNKGKLIPIYPLIKGLSNTVIKKTLKSIFQDDFYIKDYLEDSIKTKYELIDIKEALSKIHFPEKMEDVYSARKRLAFDEFFLFMLKINSLKEDKGKLINQNPIKSFDNVDNIISKLPYELTKGQSEALEDIKKDLSSPYLMNRLIQGDVGCGKTIIAILACLSVISKGYQAVIMAPTEVLATQHFNEILKMINDFDLDYVKPALLVGSLKQSEKKRIQSDIKEGNVNFIIGTHALIQDKVSYNNLKIAITDEQHRFGVNQRLHLMNSGNGVNVLVLSATPIPRTLGLILYGDLDVSVIKDLPSNRLPIKNTVVGENYREKLYRFIYKQLLEGRQAYIICPMVEEGNLDNVENVMDYTDKIRQVFPKDINIGTLHGKLKPKEKDDIMNSFKNNEIQILVSTTVVEVGVNVPNATVIMIENAERFGLASLHQLRGRVGRGDKQSYCIFLCTGNSEKSLKKLEILGKSNDGFLIASEDLKQRGPGDFFGIKQSGLPDFKIADIYTNADVLQLAKEISEEYSANLDEKKLHTLLNDIDKSNVIDFHSICL